jgi:hypothetical protein
MHHATKTTTDPYKMSDGRASIFPENPKCFEYLRLCYKEVNYLTLPQYSDTLYKTHKSPRGMKHEPTPNGYITS